MSATDGCHPPTPHRHDALLALRGDQDPPFDVFLSGTVFMDIVFTGLPAPPTRGTEVWTEGMGSSPGGIANLAVAASRLGLRTSLAAAFGEDMYGDFCRHALTEHEGVDLSFSQGFSGWHSPVTVSMAYDRDRAMVTHAHPAPVPPDVMIGTPPQTRACVVDLEAEPADWVLTARGNGALVFADVGWDPSEKWDAQVLDQLVYCHGFLPNSVEAMAYTRTSTPLAAVSALAERVPLAVVTCGADGVVAVDQISGETASVPALTVDALDPTGAGDVFAAAFTVGTLAGWPLEHRLRLGNLAAALSVRQFGGSLSAPGWGDIALWWAGVRPLGGALARAYGFLDDLLAGVIDAEVLLRATATIGLRPAR